MLLKTGSKALMSSSRKAKWTSRHCSRRTQGTRAVYLLYLLCFACARQHTSARVLAQFACFARAFSCFTREFYVLYSRRLPGCTGCTCCTRAVCLLYMLYSSNLLAFMVYSSSLLLERSAVGRSVLSFCSNSLHA